MNKKRKREKVELYNHSAASNRALASTFDFDFANRRLKLDERVVEVAPKVNNIAAEIQDPTYCLTAGETEEIHESSIGVIVKATTRAKRYLNSDTPLYTWLDFRWSYLQELLRVRGRGSLKVSVCATCNKTGQMYRCEDCFDKSLCCQDCCVGNHKNLPLHRIKVWTGDYFRKTSLCDLGLVMQLGDHHNRPPCAMRQRKKLVVLHTNGIHCVAVDFCGCRVDLEHYRQLLRVAWYPATPLVPETCATTEMMELFHLLNLQGNLTVYDFVKVLESTTDGWLLETIPDRHQAFTNMIREWRNLKLFLRGGRGHCPDGISTTQPGQLSVPCRACPHPGYNLPEDYVTAPPDRQYLYRQTIAVDANFRLKNRQRTSNTVDVRLSPGLAYFVEPTEYAEHVKKHAAQAELSTCSGFDAMLLANLKKAKGLNATGVVGVACSRHEHWRPNGMGDLQKGERQCNVDFVLLAALVGLRLQLLITYDIACQYFKNFWARMRAFPERMRLNVPSNQVTVKVPKGHLRAHEESCQGPFALAYTDGVGETDGEGIERLWSWLNKAAPSAKEMTPAARQELLDDFCSSINWRKTIGLCNILCRRMLDALKHAITHREEYLAFDARVRERIPDHVRDWERMLASWNQDNRRPCPYTSSQPHVNFNAARLALLREEQHEMGQQGVIADHTPVSFICLGLELENMQIALQADVAAIPFGNALTEVTRNDRRRALRRKLREFRQQQLVYMPGLTQHVNFAADGSVEADAAVEVEGIPLFLPSEARIQDSRAQVCQAGLPQLEERLRETQAREGLDDLRRQLRTRTFANKYKIKNMVGQRANTRGRQWLATIDRRALAAAKKYRRARNALFQLRGPGDWERTLWVLQDEDIRSFNERALTEHEQAQRAAIRQAAGMPIEGVFGLDFADNLQICEGRRTISWIWLAEGGGDDDNDPTVQECLRIEWAKSKARASRWWEEVSLLHEEMRRAVAYCHSRSQWWRDQAEDVGIEETAEIREGRRAYALAHADSETRLANHWAQRWAPLRVKAEEFMHDYPMLNVANGGANAEEDDLPAEQHENPLLPAGMDAPNDADGAAADPDAAALPLDAPIVELELEEDEGYADDYDFHADEF